MNAYLGHESQMSRIEEHRLVGGKGEGLRLLEIDNGIGLQMTLSLDRCCDISRLSFRGINMGYFAPCGYVAPSYHHGTNFLNGFTAGFLTTCGLESVGSPCVDEGESLPQHGSISATPASQVWWAEEDSMLVIHAVMEDASLFGRKLRMHRRIVIPTDRCSLTIEDAICNQGSRTEPIELLYHFNMGYPLLDEESQLIINSHDRVAPRDVHAAQHISDWQSMEKPQHLYQERCYYHTCDKQAHAALWQPKLQQGVIIRWDAENLDCFTQWKMMGVHDYVLGLEPGNCYPDGRDVMRRKNILKFAAPGETLHYTVHVDFVTEMEV